MDELLSILDIKGSTVTMDTGGCHKRLVKKILAQQADDVITVKTDQKTLYESIEDLFHRAVKNQFKGLPHNCCEILERGHGRLEERRYWLTDLPSRSLKNQGYWPGLRGVGMVHRKCQVGDKIQSSLHFYLTSFSGDIERFAYAVRHHWRVETCLHWTLDVSFHEDLCRVRKGDGAENLSVLRRIALNLLKQERTEKVGIACKRKMGGWDHQYLAKVLMAGAVPAG